jgi:uncharacterized membrane protein YvbJ
MLCSNCQTENSKRAKKCKKCGEKLLVSNKQPVVEQDSVVHMPISGVAFHRATLKKKKSAATSEISTGFYMSIMIATLVFPLIGFIVGYTYIKKSSLAAKKAGKHWVAAGISVILIYAIVLILN